MMKLFLATTTLGISLTLGACTTATPAQKQALRESEELTAKLRVGMTKKDIKREGFEVGTCRGSEASYEECSINFGIPGQDSIFISDYASSKQREVKLSFEKGHLKDWKTVDMTRIHDHTPYSAPDGNRDPLQPKMPR